MKFWMLSNFNRNTSLIFIKSLLVHCCNCFAILTCFAFLTQLSINPFHWLKNFIFSSLPFTLLPCFVITSLLQLISCFVILQLMIFKPLFFVRTVDRIVYVIKNILPGAVIPALNAFQSYAICYWFTCGSASNSFVICSCLLAFINGWSKSYELFSTDIGLCLRNQTKAFKYVYIYTEKDMAEVFAKIYRFNIYLLTVIATAIFWKSHLFDSGPYFHFYSSESSFIGFVLDAVLVTTSSAVPVVFNNLFIQIFKSWFNEPIHVKTVAYKNLEVIIVKNLKSEDEFQKRYSFYMLKGLLATSSECRKLVFQIVGNRNNSLLWSELASSLLSQINELQTRLKTFRFYLKKLSIQDDLKNQNPKFDNQRFAADGLERSYANISLTKKSEDLEQTSVELDLNKSLSMSIFSSQVADPFIPWANMKTPTEFGPALMSSRFRMEYPGSLRNCKSGPSIKPPPGLLSEHLNYWHKWASNTRLVNYLFRKDLALMCNDLFCDFEVFVVACDLLTLMTENAVKEDKHGVVQQDLPQIFTQLADVFVTLEQNCKNGE